MPRASYESTFRRHDYASALAAVSRTSRAKVNELARDGGSFLGAAAYYGHVDACACLLDMGADIELRNARGRTPLLSAAWGLDSGTSMEYRRRTFELLLARGADIQAADEEGKTVLHYTLEAARVAPEFVRVVLEHGADPNALTEYGASPLMRAARSVHLPSIELLLEHGADASVKTPFGDALLSAVDHAVFDHEREALPAVVARLRAAGAPLDGVDEDTGVTLLIAAARVGDASLLEASLEAGADVSAVDWHGRGALHTAAARGHLECVRLLLQASAPTDQPDEDGELPAQVAKDDAIRALLPPPPPRPKAKRGRRKR